MQRISEALKLAVIVEWGRSFVLEGECTQKQEFFFAHIPTQQGVLEKVPQPRLLA
jgi:hypothetical protein